MPAVAWSSVLMPLRMVARDELAAVLHLAWPVMTTLVLNFMLVLVNTLVVGHTGAENLAAAALANMYFNAAGNSMLFGTASACDTLQSQAYGARNFARVGHISQRGLVIMLVMAVLTSTVLYNADAVLSRMGQEAHTVELSTAYVRLLIPGLPGALLYEILKKHLQNIGIVVPTMLIQVAAICVNGLLAFGLVYHSRLGFLGAPVAMSLSNWFMLLCMTFFFRFHRAVHAFVRSWGLAVQSTAAQLSLRGTGAPDPVHPSVKVAPHQSTVGSAGPREDDSGLMNDSAQVDDSALDVPDKPSVESNSAVHVVKPSNAAPEAGAPPPPDDEGIADIDDRIDATWVALSPQAAFSGWWEFLSLGLPSAVMLMCEWGSYEAVSIFAGMISTLTLASHTVIAMTAGLSFMPALGMSIAASVRMGQQMGERKPAAAAFTYRIIVGATLAYTFVNALFILSVHTVWARVFTDDDEVEALISRWLWILAAYTLFDALQCVSCGALRALGRPSLAACGNVIAYLVCGLPLCYAFGMHAKLGLPGLWLGFCIAVTVAFVVLNIALYCTDWERAAVKAYERATADVIAKQRSAGVHAEADGCVAAVTAANGPAITTIAFQADMAALSSPVTAVTAANGILSCESTTGDEACV